MIHPQFCYLSCSWVDKLLTYFTLPKGHCEYNMQ